MKLVIMLCVFNRVRFISRKDVCILNPHSSEIVLLAVFFFIQEDLLGEVQGRFRRSWFLQVQGYFDT